MAYEGDLSASLVGKNDAFLNIKNILRKGFDGEVNHMDYKDENSFRGAVKVRLSALVVGTPLTIFNYFDTQSTSEGNSRRIIFVEHDQIMKNISVPAYSEQEIEFICKELDYLQNLEPQKVFHKKIEELADKWRNEKQKQANGDTITQSANKIITQHCSFTHKIIYSVFCTIGEKFIFPRCAFYGKFCFFEFFPIH